MHGRVGGRFDPLGWTQATYTALRQCGQSIDIVGSDADLQAYKLVIIACCSISDVKLATSLSKTEATIVLLPRSGSKTEHCAIPSELPPGEFQSLLPIKVVRSESLPPEITLCATLPGSTSGPGQEKEKPLSNAQQMFCCEWREKLETNLPCSGHFDDGWGFHYQLGKVHYLNAWLTGESLKVFVREILVTAGLVPIDCPAGLRLRSMKTLSTSRITTGNLPTPETLDKHNNELHFACHYGPDSIDLLALDELPDFHKKAMQRRLLLGETTLNPADFAVWVV